MNQSREGSWEHTVGTGHWEVQMTTASPAQGKGGGWVGGGGGCVGGRGPARERGRRAHDGGARKPLFINWQQEGSVGHWDVQVRGVRGAGTRQVRAGA